MSLIALFGFSKRPQADSQNTGRDVYERPFGVATVSVAGLGGANNIRSLSPTAPTGFNLALVTPSTLTGTGNELNTNPVLQPLNNQPRQF